MNDSDIIALYESRSEQAIAETEQKYGRYCTSIALRILASPADAEECVNDTWLSLWNTIPPNRPKDLKTYAGRIVRNHAIKKYRYLSAEKRKDTRYAVALDELSEILPDEEDGEREADRIALRDALNRFLAGLPQKSRVVFLRRYFYMDSAEEIAARLGIPVGSVRQILHRTRKKLQKFLEQEGLLP